MSLSGGIDFDIGMIFLSLVNPVGKGLLLCLIVMVDRLPRIRIGSHAERYAVRKKRGYRVPVLACRLAIKAGTRQAGGARLLAECTPLFVLRADRAVCPAGFLPVDTARKQDALIYGFRFARINSPGFILLSLTCPGVLRAVFTGPSAPFARRQLCEAAGIAASGHLTDQARKARPISAGDSG